MKSAAIGAGALGSSFSGSGPSVFAWAREADADAVELAMAISFEKAGIPVRAYRGAIDSPGVKIIENNEALVAA